MKAMRTILIATALAVASPLLPASSHESQGQLTEGEVRKVDRDANKITIRHGPIVNVDMPAMTMVFQVRDPSLLDPVKAGDRIRFAVEKAGGAYIVTRIAPVK